MLIPLLLSTAAWALPDGLEVHAYAGGGYQLEASGGEIDNRLSVNYARLQAAWNSVEHFITERAAATGLTWITMK